MHLQTGICPMIARAYTWSTPVIHSRPQQDNLPMVSSSKVSQYPHRSTCFFLQTRVAIEFLLSELQVTYLNNISREDDGSERSCSGGGYPIHDCVDINHNVCLLILTQIPPKNSLAPGISLPKPTKPHYPL